MILSNERKDRERLAVSHYAKLRGAGRDDQQSIAQAANLVPVSPEEFMSDVWPKYKDAAWVKRAEETAKNPPGKYPEII